MNTPSSTAIPEAPEHAPEHGLRRHGRVCWPNYFDARVWFSFLLRGDVRGDGDIGSEETRKRFLMWWLCFGRKGHPSRPATPEQRRVAWETVPFRDGQSVPRVLHFVLHARQDVSDAVRIDRPDGPKRGLAWLLLHGLQEFGIGDLVDGEVRAWLNAPAIPDDRDVLPMTNLMALLWAFRDDFPARFDTATGEGRRRLVAWAYSAGLLEYDLGRLLSADVRNALASPPPGCGIGTPPQQAFLCWMSGFPGVPAEPPATPAAMERLGAWYRSLRDSVFAPRLTPSPADPVEAPSIRPPFLPPVKGGCTLVGYAYGELGVGEDVRMMARALSDNGVPFSITDFSCGTVARKSDVSAAAHVAEGFPHAATVFCLTGFDTARFLVERDFRTTEGRCAIGYWPWELPRWPEPWWSAVGLMDELWVSSRFTQEAFAPRSPVPVIHMPMTVELPAVAPVMRRQFGLPESAFLFLYVFDANSYLERKNPLAAALAFRRAFPRGDEPAGLVFKIMNPPEGNPAWQAFLEVCAEDRRIRIIAETMDRPYVLGLMQACDAYLSLHRSEGFGRTIAEAMLLGKPVVATGWSGSNEVVRPDTAIAVKASPRPIAAGEYPWGEGTYWADPDLDHAAWGLRALFGDATLRARLGAAGQAHVRLHHNAGTVGRRYRERLMALGLL